MVFGLSDRNLIVVLSLVACVVLVISNARASLSSIFNVSLISSAESFNQPFAFVHELKNKSDYQALTRLPVDRKAAGVAPNLTVSSFVAVNGVIDEQVVPVHDLTVNTNDESQETGKATGVDRQQEGKQETTSEEQKANKPLNILILYPDDLRHDSIGCAGTQPVMTPYLDSLAKEGIRFTQNAVTTSICWISRATMLTGQYMARHNSTTLEDPVFCKPTKWNATWPYLLQKAGYYVGHSGKWQFYNDDFVINAFNWTSLHEGEHWYPWPDGSGGKNGKPLYQHACDKSEEEVIQFIKDRPKDRPFAVTVAFYPPKAIGIGSEQWFPKNETKKLYENTTIPEPYKWNESWWKLPSFFRPQNEARTRWEQRFGTHELYQNSMKCYYALITEVDKACEHIVDELKRQGIYDETLIIFTADNGFFLGEHGLAGKWYPYQESIRVPLIIRDPRMPKEKRGTLDDSFTLNIDLATTILGAANLLPHERMQGKDISDLYLKPDSKETWRKEFFYQHQSMGMDYIPASSALVRKDFKYMIYPEWNVEQFFDLINDPLEFDNILNQTEHGPLVNEMRKRHDELKLQVP